MNITLDNITSEDKVVLKEFFLDFQTSVLPLCTEVEQASLIKVITPFTELNVYIYRKKYDEWVIDSRGNLGDKHKPFLFTISQAEKLVPLYLRGIYTFITEEEFASL